ncbi:hypothetical protein CHS0354_017509 [Potamilus streckersoni]|uniref:Uncharacterized protein n=1 Tax=Potamilus streckersoni TaxID=2493646 RepID=A0AAE0VNF6_9BIVA|nr:hypothetical protein CHS0354_017509 [Potamilus streckersoni]
MALVSRTELGVRDTGISITVPDEPRAKLMYYIDCIFSVVDITGLDPNIQRFRQFQNYFTIIGHDIDRLIALCLILSPDELQDKVIFHNEEICGDSGNKFLELSNLQMRFLVTESMVIGGQNRQVRKIMVFRTIWMKKNFIDPMAHLLLRRQQEKEEEEEKNKKSSFCVIL